MFHKSRDFLEQSSNFQLSKETLYHGVNSSLNNLQSIQGMPNSYASHLLNDLHVVAPLSKCTAYSERAATGKCKKETQE